MLSKLASELLPLVTTAYKLLPLVTSLIITLSLQTPQVLTLSEMLYHNFTQCIVQGCYIGVVQSFTVYTI